jgi:Flp pilus assembly protein CpaB
VQVTDTINRYRRLIAASLAAITLFAAIAAVKGTRPTTDVLVAARDLGAGSVIAADDVVVRTVATTLALGATDEPAQLVGHTLLVNVTSGQPMYDTFALDHTSIPEGFAAVPLRPSDGAVANIVRPGERVDIVGQRTASDAPTVLARNLAVLTVAVPRATGLLKSSSDSPLVVVVADSYTAGALAAASLAGPVALTLRS